MFSVGNREHAKYYTERLPWYLNKYILRRDVEPFEPLYQFSDPEARRASSVARQDVNDFDKDAKTAQAYNNPTT